MYPLYLALAADIEPAAKATHSPPPQAAGQPERFSRIKGALADPQRTRASLQRGGVKVILGTQEMVMALGLRHLLGSGILVMLTD